MVSPNYQRLFTPAQETLLKKAGRFHVIKTIQPFQDISGLFSQNDKIFAIDPDFCNWSVSNKILDSIPHLKAICLQTTSFSWIDVKHLGERRIPVIHLENFCTEAVAEWSLLMMQSVLRKIPLLAKTGWKQGYEKFCGMELRGKLVGIVGMGHIGTRIAELCQSLGMRVQYWSKHSRDNRFSYTSLSRLMKTSDCIFPTIAQNEQTQGLLNDRLLKSMKRTAVFISVVHEIYNHKLLLEMVKRETLFGYAFEQEGGGVFDKYEGNVWAGPAHAWVTDESFQRNAAAWVQSIVDTARGRYTHQINEQFFPATTQ